METQVEKVSYCIGQQIGNDLQRQGIEVCAQTLGQSISDALAQAEPKLSQDEQGQVMQAFQMEMQAKQQQAAAVAGEANRKAGLDFLNEKESAEGVQKTESGLLYKIIEEGSGPSPKPTDTVECHYRGTLIDGKEFDSSHSRGETASFPVNGVIQGWQEALPMMKVGAKWELYIHADLAYGNQGAGADIGPGAALIFEIELVSIK